jgi:hypothetical protein
MAEDQRETNTMYDKIMNVPGAKPIGKPEDKKKAADHILKSYEDRASSRDESIMENFADSVNKPARSIGERIEGEEGQ